MEGPCVRQIRVADTRLGKVVNGSFQGFHHIFRNAVRLCLGLDAQSIALTMTDGLAESGTMQESQRL